jgi:hypothetical protein
VAKPRPQTSKRLTRTGARNLQGGVAGSNPAVPTPDDLAICPGHRLFSGIFAIVIH